MVSLDVTKTPRTLLVAAACALVLVGCGKKDEGLPAAPTAGAAGSPTSGAAAPPPPGHTAAEMKQVEDADAAAAKRPL